MPGAWARNLARLIDLTTPQDGNRARHVRLHRVNHVSLGEGLQRWLDRPELGNASSRRRRSSGSIRVSAWRFRSSVAC